MKNEKRKTIVGVTGAKGYIGSALVRNGCTPLVCDVTDYTAAEAEVCRVKPDIILHLASVSDPDKCEVDPKKSSHVNLMGANNIAMICALKNIPLAFLSSAQIWGGGWWESLWNRHAENSKLTWAVNAYGMQKCAAEFAVTTANIGEYKNAKIIRTSHVFNKARFQKELDGLALGVHVDAPRFLKRSFIHLEDFVYQVSEYCKRFYAMPPVLHLAGTQTVSYYDFWLEVAKQFDFDPALIKGRRFEKKYPFLAKRPHNGGLDVHLSQTLGFKQFSYIGGIRKMKNES